MKSETWADGGQRYLLIRGLPPLGLPRCPMGGGVWATPPVDEEMGRVVWCSGTYHPTVHGVPQFELSLEQRQAAQDAVQALVGANVGGEE